MQKGIRIIANLYLVVALFTPLLVYIGLVLGEFTGDTTLISLPGQHQLAVIALLFLPILALRQTKLCLTKKPIQPDLPIKDPSGN